jgi:hypothetical protein
MTKRRTLRYNRTDYLYRLRDFVDAVMAANPHLGYNITFYCAYAGHSLVVGHTVIRAEEVEFVMEHGGFVEFAKDLMPEGWEQGEHGWPRRKAEAGDDVVNTFSEETCHRMYPNGDGSVYTEPDEDESLAAMKELERQERHEHTELANEYLKEQLRKRDLAIAAVRKCWTMGQPSSMNIAIAEMNAILGDEDIAQRPVEDPTVSAVANAPGVTKRKWYGANEE